MPRSFRLAAAALVVAGCARATARVLPERATWRRRAAPERRPATAYFGCGGAAAFPLMPQSSEPSFLSLALLQAVPGSGFLPWAPV